jgi:hypothetical protein
MYYYKISGEPIINKVYFRGNLKIHIVGVLVVIIWGIGNSLNPIATGKAGVEISYGFSHT